MLEASNEYQITNGWHMTGVYHSKLPPNLAASDQLLNLLSEFCFHRPGQRAIVGTASACFSQKIVSLLLPSPPVPISNGIEFCSMGRNLS